MKRLRILLILMLSLTFISQSNAQDDIDQFLKESVEDGEKLIGAYISPAIKAFSLGMNQGWYNTAKPHKVAGVDLTFTGSLMKVPSSEQMFDVNALGLTDISLVDGSGNPRSDGNIPTVLGPDTPPTFSLNSTLGDPSDDFDGPSGLALGEDVKFLENKMPAAMLQLGFGLPKGTDIKLRLVPKIDVGDDGKFNLFGIGVMHDVKQYIPGLKNMPFDLSALIGYTKMKLDVAFDPTANPDQRGLFEVKSTTIQGIASKKFSVVTFYGGLGYNIAKSNLAMLGTYDIGGSNIKDPVDLSYAASGFRASAGMRLKLAVFTFHADYTLQKYSALTVGFGISVR
ncbi:MAG TPA: hypothetical protein PK185_06345 [Cyclobacteriaceae bacterium]|nr:hypothetical protein [Cyclobacteriaceae bacterium]HRK53514.1 hypothetical protein [Cyclobacteriaceae bacterium]